MRSYLVPIVVLVVVCFGFSSSVFATPEPASQRRLPLRERRLTPEQLSYSEGECCFTFPKYDFCCHASLAGTSLLGIWDESLGFVLRGGCEKGQEARLVVGEVLADPCNAPRPDCCAVLKGAIGVGLMPFKIIKTAALQSGKIGVHVVDLISSPITCEPVCQRLFGVSAVAE